MKIKPIEKTKCFFILDIGRQAYLSNEDPSERFDDSDLDHLYREIVEGVYYPVNDNDCVNGKKIAGFFYDENEKKCLIFYNNEFFTDAEWKPISEKFIKVMSDSENIMQ